MMPSSLPTEDAWSKAVKDFGIGPYDGAQDSTSSKGEDDEHREPAGKSLPDGGGGEGAPLEYYLSYPQEEAVGWKHSSVPGDLDRPPRGGSPDQDTKDDVVPTVGPPPHSITDDGSDDDGSDASQLPSGRLPAARADYYDRTVYGFSVSSIDQIWPSEDSGAYAGEEKCQPDEDGSDASQLPSPRKNEVTMDDLLSAFGNSDQGFVWEDTSGPSGFPSEDFSENSDYSKLNDGSLGGHLSSFDVSIAAPILGEPMTDRTATDIKLVTDLTKDFIKGYGKKNIVRRHVLAFLQDRGLPQYLASDIVRCLKHQHKVVIPDVMDTFPVGRLASDGRFGLGSVHRGLTDLFVRHSDDPEVSSVIRRCATRVSRILASLDEMEAGHGR